MPDLENQASGELERALRQLAYLLWFSELAGTFWPHSSSRPPPQAQEEDEDKEWSSADQESEQEEEEPFSGGSDFSEGE